MHRALFHNIWIPDHMLPTLTTSIAQGSMYNNQPHIAYLNRSILVFFLIAWLFEERATFRLLSFGNIEQVRTISRELKRSKVDWRGTVCAHRILKFSVGENFRHLIIILIFLDPYKEYSDLHHMGEKFLQHKGSWAWWNFYCSRVTHHLLSSLIGPCLLRLLTSIVFDSLLSLQIWKWYLVRK